MTDTPPVDAQPVEPLTAAIAEGLHAAMCYGPTTLHNRLACERPQVYLALAEAAVAHLAVREVLDAEQRSAAAAFGALSAVGDDLDATLDAARAGDGLLREAIVVAIASLDRGTESDAVAERLRAALAVEGSER